MIGVELRIGTRGGGVNPKAYRELVADVEGLVLQIDQVVPGDVLPWGLRHGERSGALVVRLEPLETTGGDDSRVRQTAVAVVQGAVDLRQHSGLPDYYTEDGVALLERAARRRGAVRGIDAVELAVLNGTELVAAALDDALIAHAAETMTTASTADGSVEGVLDTLSTRHRTARASVFDTRTRRAVAVRAGAVSIQELHRHFGRRVLVVGALTRNGLGQPVRVAAEHIEALPAIADRSRLRELIGIAPDWTGGRSSSEALAELRDRA